MTPKKPVAHVEGHPIFKEFREAHPRSYLVHLFQLVETTPKQGSEGEPGWEVGYYNPDDDQVTVFEVQSDASVTAKPSERAYKEEKTSIPPLKLEKVNVSYDQALKKIQSLQCESYPQEKPMKIMVLLQSLDDLGTLWNMTYITQRFKTLNVKINAENGDVVDQKLFSIFEIQK